MLDNHRFITLLPLLGKISEKLVKKMLNWEERDTQMWAVWVQEHKREPGLFSKRCCSCFTKWTHKGSCLPRFWWWIDNLTHRQILPGLTEAGICGRMLKFTKNYLVDHEVHVRVGKTISCELTKWNRGIPQGSALGPD